MQDSPEDKYAELKAEEAAAEVPTHDADGKQLTKKQQGQERKRAEKERAEAKKHAAAKMHPQVRPGEDCRDCAPCSGASRHATCQGAQMLLLSGSGATNTAQADAGSMAGAQGVMTLLNAIACMLQLVQLSAVYSISHTLPRQASTCSGCRRFPCFPCRTSCKLQ